MKLEIPYNGTTLPLSLPDDVVVDILEPNRMDWPSEDDRSRVRRAVNRPLSSKPLGEFLEGGKNVLVLVNDATRPTPTRIVLDSISDELESADAGFIVATGAHRAPTEPEYRQIFGQACDTLRPRCKAHDARDYGSLVDLGKTRNGTPVLINKAVLEADRIIVIGSVEPHYFAGYTGGRKAFLPGVAGFRSIETNHALALSEEARACALTRNPVSQDMDDVLELIRVPVFSIMTVLDKDQNLAWCSAGDIRASFLDAVKRADAIFTVPIRRKADLVIAVARYPMDIDLYQSQKAMENGSLALKDGGSLILVSSCRDGVGDSTFLELLGVSSSLPDLLARIGRGYRLGYHKAAKLALLAQRARVLALTELEPETIARAHMEACTDLQTCVRGILSALGPGAVLAYLPDGSVTVPRLLPGDTASRDSEG